MRGVLWKVPAMSSQCQRRVHHCSAPLSGHDFYTRQTHCSLQRMLLVVANTGSGSGGGGGGGSVGGSGSGGGSGLYFCSSFFCNNTIHVNLSL